MENEYRKQLRRLLNKVNVVTSAHRHGWFVSNEMLDNLPKRQIEVEGVITSQEASLAEKLEEPSGAQTKWISIEDQLPSRGSIVLAYMPFVDFQYAILNYDKDWHDLLDNTYTPIGEVSHWQPLPTTPEDDG